MRDTRSDLQETNRDRLRRVPLFAELEDEDLDRLAGLSRILLLRRKEGLFAEGEEYRGLFVILEGLAVVYKLSEDGRMLILHVCRPGDSLAEVPLFDEGSTVYPAHARVTRDSEVLFLPRERFAPFLKQHPEVAWELLKAFASRLKEMSLQLEGVTLREVTSRLARYLIREMESAGVAGEPQPVLTLDLAKGSLASYLGTVHETLSRTFARLTKQRILEVDGPRVTVLDPARLKRLL
jgi:CRP/FNR family transcriptional regulator, dissimilatory nitrate respiration regulator